MEQERKTSFKTVLMNSWYASVQVIKHIESLRKIYYCPIKTNRHVDDSEGRREHRRVDKLEWAAEEQKEGKTVHLKKMPKGHRLKLFRLVLSTEHADYIVTNDMTQRNSDVVKHHCGVRWKIEQFHRESKQRTGPVGAVLSKTSYRP